MVLLQILRNAAVAEYKPAKGTPCIYSGLCVCHSATRQPTLPLSISVNVLIVRVRNTLLTWPPLAYCSYRVSGESVRLLKVEMF